MLDADEDLVRFLLLGELDDVLPGHVATHQQVGFTGDPVLGQQLFGKGEVFLGLDDLLLGLSSPPTCEVGTRTVAFIALAYVTADFKAFGHALEPGCPTASSSRPSLG